MIKDELREILSYRRGFGSVGNAKFQQEYLIPKIAELGYIPQRMGLNLYVKCGHPTTTLYCAHMDTVHKSKGNTIINTIIEKDGWFHADGGVCLGADDGVGIVTMLYLMSIGVHVDFLFTDGEEHGLVGAHEFVANHSDVLEKYTHCIEVDRAGEEEIIIEQSSGVCGSVAFANQLSGKLGEMDVALLPSNNGVYTDNDAFSGIIPECVNLAAGYYNQHSKEEKVNVNFVINLVVQLGVIDYSSLIVGERAEDTRCGAAIYDEWANYDGLVFDEQSEFDWMLELTKNNPESIALYLMSIGAEVDDIFTAADDMWDEYFEDDTNG